MNPLQSTSTRTPRWRHLLCTSVLLLGGSVSNVLAAPIVTFAVTAMDVTASGTGAEILNDGTLIAANHVGNGGQTPVTLASGLTFGTSTAHLIRPNGPNFQAEWEYNGTQTYQTGWGHNASDNRGYTITNTAFDSLMDHVWWIAYSGSRSDMEIGGLTVGHTYRLQLISEKPASGTVAVEGCAPQTWSANNSVLSATWNAEDATLNMQYSRKVDNRLTGAGQGAEVFFNAYALHDMTAAAPAAPTNLAATPSNAQVGLTWTAAGGATGYNVKRSTTSGSGYSQIGTAVTTSYTDSTAANGTTYFYVVSATNGSGESGNSSQVSATPSAALSSAKDMLTFNFGGTLGAATISGTSITLTVPYGTGVTALAPTYTVSPFATCAPASGSTQNFSSPVHYIVTAQDGTTKDYTVSVTVAAASSAKDVLTFGPGATISGTSIALTVAYGTNVTSLAPTYTMSALATGSPVSGSSRDFSSPKTYVITAQDGTSKTYTVTVTVTSVQAVKQLDVTASGIGSEILNDGTLVAANHFGGVNDGMSAPAAVTLDNGLTFGTSTAHLTYNWTPVHSTATWSGASAITNVPFKTLLSNVFWLAGSQTPQLNIPGLVQGHTYRLQLISDDPQNAGVTVEGNPVSWTGTTPSVLTVTWFQEYAADTVANITLTRTAGEIKFNGYALHDLSTANSLKNITSFTFPDLGEASLSGTNISISVPFGTSVTNLSPTYTLTTGATCTPVSGTARNFGSPQTYTVTALDGTTKDYTVTVNVSAVSTAKDILACSFGALGSADITGNNVTMTVPIGTAVTSLAPTFTLSPLAAISPGSGSSQNFTNPVSYTVTAQDGSTKVYNVTVRTFADWQHSASLFILTTPDGTNLAAGAMEANFPLLVRLNSNNFDFSQAQSDGRDLRFTTTAGSSLFYQIEHWDAASSAASVWVKIPAITGNARQEIKMYWGKADALGESSAANVFNAGNGFVSVFHLGESVQDELGTVTPVNAGSTVAGGLIGKGRHFTSGSGINCGDHILNYPYASNPFTSECWFRTEVIGGSPLYFGRYATRYNGNTGDGNEVNIAISAPASLGWSSDGPGGATAATVPSVGQWYHVAATYAGGVSKIYVNGQLDGTRTGGATAMSIFNDIQMKIGGWRGSYNFAGDIDEARVSTVARSADWMKLQYENQKVLQTLVGPPVQSGSTFTVEPTSVTMNEGATTTLTAQAGSAQKLYWIRKQNGVDTVLAVDQFALDLAAGRVSGSQSFTVQLRAVYPDVVKTIDVPVTISEYQPDPVFTLTAPTTWDGRQTIIVTPDISNLAAMQATGVGTLNYSWSTAGLAVTKQAAGNTLTLTRAQNSGLLTVSLTMDNGGTPVSHSATINVQEPAGDAWVKRTPGATEKPVNGQFFARDPGTDLGQVYYNGVQSGATAAYLKVYQTQSGGDVEVAIHRQTALVGGAYAFTAPIAAGLCTYKVVFGTTSGGTDTDVASVSNLMCGDAYIIDGQSNAVADNNGGNYGTFTNEWIRSYGNMGGGNGSGWCNAVAASTSGDAGRIGNWGMAMAAKLVADYGVPVCIINGAVGGTLVSQHQANPADHTAAGSSYGIYANILNRVVAAKLTHGIRGVLWHQGENNSGAAAPTGDWDYKSYQQYFMDMAAAWKQDYPNIKHYYIFQVWPLPCGMGPKGDQLREVQRTLPRLFSNMSIMSTVGVSGGSRGLCHFDAAGYEQIANLIAPLVERDNYGLVPATSITAPDLKRAYFTTAAKTSIALEFDQDMNWNSAATANFYLDKLAGKVTAGSVSGHVITLQLSAAATQQTIDYLEDAIWSGSSTNLLRGANNIAALTFADVVIGPPAAATLTATPGSNQVSLGWTTVAGATGYNVKRALGAGGTFSLIGTATGTSYTDTSAVAGTTYYYLVTATTSVSGSVGEGADSNVAGATPTSLGVAFASWMTGKGLSGGAAGGDPDHDSLNNALEYVLGGEPNPATAGSNSIGLLPKVTQSGSNLIFTYRRADIALNQPGVAIDAEYGSDLTGWTPAQNNVKGVVIAVTDDGFGTGIDKVEVSIPRALAAGSKLFAHLKVTLP